jgi:nucleoside-diphosphate-sugar epimerase
MLVFVTGAAGFVGTAVVAELIKHNHQVLGLARSDASAEKISKAGATVHRGDMLDLESLKSGAKGADAVIHLAYNHNFAEYAKAAEQDADAIKAIAEAITGTGKPFVIVSGTLVGHPGSILKEDDEVDTSNAFAVRQLNTNLVLELSKKNGFRASCVRLSPTVHGAGDGGLIPMMAAMAKAAGHVTMIGDGSQRWPAVHRYDAAVLVSTCNPCRPHHLG